MRSNRQLEMDFYHEIKRLNSVEKSFLVLEKYIQKLGFDGASYTVVPEFVLNNSFRSGPIFLFSDLFPQSFIEQYSTERFDENDFTIPRIKAGFYEHMDWKKYRNSNLLSDAEKQVLHIAEQEHGIINGISIPTMDGITGVSGVSIISSEKDASFGLLKAEKLSPLKGMIDIFHMKNHSCSGYFMKPFFSELSDNEVAILKYISTGGLMKNICYETGISVSYATNILSNLRKKLGGVTVAQIMFEIDSRYFD